MNNLEVITYIRNIIESLDEENFFEQPFMDPEVLSDEILKMVKINIENGFTEPKLTESQFEQVIKNTKTIVVDKTLDELLHKDLVKIIGMNDDGELLYSLNQEK